MLSELSWTPRKSLSYRVPMHISSVGVDQEVFFLGGGSEGEGVKLAPP
jgi:hypothetical protein